MIELAFLIRMIIAWFPEVNERAGPWSILYKPTEAACRPVRKVLPTFFGVDSAPIFWLMLLSLVNELLFGGKEGLLTMMAQQAEAGM